MKNKRPERKNPYAAWDVGQVMAEMERLERWQPIGRADRWHRTHHLRWLGKFMLDLPEECRRGHRASLAARLNAMHAGIFIAPECEAAT